MPMILEWDVWQPGVHRLLIVSCALASANIYKVELAMHKINSRAIPQQQNDVETLKCMHVKQKLMIAKSNHTTLCTRTTFNDFHWTFWQKKIYLKNSAGAKFGNRMTAQTATRNCVTVELPSSIGQTSETTKSMK
jgi:hypothetical protein